MKKAYYFPITIFVVLAVALPWRSHAQTALISLDQVIDDAEVILVGRVLESRFLRPDRFDVRSEGVVFRIEVQRRLIGSMTNDTINIIKIDSLHRARPFFLFEPGQYLLMLRPFELHPDFRRKYELGPDQFFYPIYDELGVINLEDKDGPEYLRATEDHLRGLPPIPSLDTPVSLLIDSLAIKKHEVFASNLIGDENFVKELDKHLDNAQKHLARGDSLNCAWQVEDFQKKVLREYEKTSEQTKKNQPRDKRFVTKEGYMLLYYNAKYILDRLPKKK